MKPQLNIWKIGGQVIANSEILDQVLDAFSSLSDSKLLVHGGGPQASDLCHKLDIPIKKIGGRRLTDTATLEVVVMVYAGLINKSLVAALQSKNVNALGLSGADANIIQAQKRAVLDIDYGFAGDIIPSKQSAINLQGLLSLGLSPVLCPLTHDGQGQLLNTNADTIAAYVARELCSRYVVNLIYCFDRPGVLLDTQDPESVISMLTHDKYLQLKKENRIVDGMIPKLDNAFTALQQGVDRIQLCDWKGILNNNQGGTTLCTN